MRTKFWSESLVAFSQHTCRHFRRMLANERGASIVFIAMTMPALIGAMGLAAEVSYWRLHQRSMQNAADAAAIAAATSNSTNFAAVGKGVAAEYGFQDGTGQVVVSVTKPSTAT